MSGLRARARPKPTIEEKSSPPSRVPISGQGLGISGTNPILSPKVAFSVLLLLRLSSAIYATIPDCDEVFNFWEPTHYLSHNSGLQTWEYSPVYAIRSWTYIALHSLLSRPISLIPGLTKVHEFYGLRAIFALACAYSEKRLYTAVSSQINRRVGLLYLLFTICSAGMFHSAAAFLPSTFAMYTTMLATAAFLERRVVGGILWTAVGGFLGWPFSLAMCVPFILEEVVIGVVNGGLGGSFVKFIKGGVLSLVLLCTIVAIDSVFYRKLEIVPLNIVLYNVFSDSSKGPNIYGTEPWWFYLGNLSLNFNLLLPLSLVVAPLLGICAFLTPLVSPRHFASSLPFYLWLAIFTLQPHKEERFMFVAYPALILNAATSYSILVTFTGILSQHLPQRLRRLFSLVIYTVVIIAPLSLSRAVAIVSSYSAPLHIYTMLPPDAMGNLCVGDEWYRFPSSYLIPERVKVRWVKGGFDGLLPGRFYEGTKGWREGTWRVPKGMNDLNKSDPGKYISITQCDYFVDLNFKVENYTEQLPQMNWELLDEYQFLNAEKTSFLSRAFRIPWIIAPDLREWGTYRVYKKRELKWLEGTGEDGKL